jgi:DNA-binding HxlR family transcriptional regulator
MPRPKDSSSRSYKLIYDALSSGERYFEELHYLTKLHRNTLSDRLKYLCSRGMIGRRKEGHRIYYALLEPLTDGRNVLSIRGLKWMDYLETKHQREERERKMYRSIKDIMKEQQTANRFREAMANEISKFHETLDELVETPESQEILNLTTDWQKISMNDLCLILSLNKIVVNLSSTKQICPECHHYGTRTDPETDEVVCEKCGIVVTDDVMPPEARLELIVSFLRKSHPKLHLMHA